MKINWKARFKNKTFLVSFWALIIALANNVAESYFGINVEIFTAKITNTFEIILMILGALGIIIDPLTKGIGDSQQGLTYEKPRADGDKHE